MMKTVNRNNWVFHRIRADAFFDDMTFLAGDIETYKHTVALLAVHASISLADAVLVKYTGRRSTDQDHRVVLSMLTKLCGVHRLPSDGVRHLSWLLGKKTDFAYSDRLVIRSEAESARTKAQQFVTWVNRNFLEVKYNDAS
jgi:hypothetical protein